MTVQEDAEQKITHRAPKRALPTRRVLVRTQLRLASAGAELSGARLAAFHIKAAADRAGMAQRQASLATRFLIDNELWVKVGREIYSVTEDGRRFGALWESDEPKARALLGELLGQSWFAQVAGSVLARGPVPLEHMLHPLQKAAGAQDSSMSMVMHLLEWMTVALLVEQTEDGLVTAGPALECLTPAAPPPTEEPDLAAAHSRIPHQEEMPVPSAPTSAEGSGAPIALSVDIRLTMDEMSSLAPEDLAQFMGFLNAVRRVRREISTSS